MKEGIHYAKEIEAAILGICLLEKDAFGRVYSLIKPEMFYMADNVHVFQTMSEMYDQSAPIDHLTVWQRMTEKGIELSASNSAWYLTKLSMNVVSSSHLEYHCHLVKTFWKKRELETITRSGFDASEDPNAQANEISKKLFEILGSEVKQDWYDLNDLYWNLLIHQNEIRDGKKTLLTTGFKAIDRLNGGFSPGQLIVIGARPSVGKSALMNKIAFAAARQQFTVGIISLEMNNTDIAARLASLQSDTSFNVIYRNLFNDENEHRIFYDTISKSSQLPIYVSDKTKVDVNEIRAKAWKLKHKKGLSILIIDYLQLVDSAGGKSNYNREQEVAKISRGLKLMAMEFEIPVVVLCQLNRSVTARKGKDRYPQLSDLRESGAIEQDADVVMMLHRDWMSGHQAHPETGESTEYEADLLGVKWRNGATFHLPLEFSPGLMKFSERGSQLIPVHIPKDRGEEDPF
jgi:replicative DNA helicase